MTYSRAAVIVVSIAFALARLLGAKSEAFQAFSHLWVGGLIAAWWVLREAGDTLPSRRKLSGAATFAGWMGAALSAVEFYAARSLIWSAIRRVLETAGVEL